MPAINMPFSTSSPKKATQSNDSGLGIQLGDMSNSSGLESDELESLDPKCDKASKTPSIVLEVEDDSDDFAEVEGFSCVSMASKKCGNTLKWVIFTVLGLCYAAYFITALVRNGLNHCADHVHQDLKVLIILTVAGLVIFLAWFVKSKFSDDLNRVIVIPVGTIVERHWNILKWILAVSVGGGIAAMIITSAVKRPSNLTSLLGWAVLIAVLLICSRAPRKIKWRPVIGGFVLQFYFAALILKWDRGYDLFSAIGKVFTKFLSFTDAGSSFVLGKLDDHFFAFKVLPVIIFFSCVITMLYYLGVMQAVIGKIAFLMRITLGTTAAESLCAAGNIFVGQTEAPIMIRPFLTMMTRSELHAVMVGGFATIAGAVLAAYIMKGVPAIHLLTACLMNAPTALAVSKILYPELGRSKIAKMQEAILASEPYNNVIEAAAAGASAAISLVANVAANLIAFVALLHFANQALSWFGGFVCYPELSFELACSYLFMPLAFLMGVEWKDAGAVAELIGIKTFLNEFVAYDKLSEMIDNRVKCLDGAMLSVRSETIATYALCGFANLSSIGIQLGGLGSMAPNRLGDFACIAVSALLGGIVTNLLTACVAGVLVVDFELASSCMNATVPVVNETMTLLNGTITAINATAIL